MQKRKYFLPFFGISFFLAVCLFLLGQIGGLGWLENGIQISVFSLSSLIHLSDGSSMQIPTLQKENLHLTQLLATMQLVQADNKALRDQFATTAPASSTLLPATIVGTATLPNVVPEMYILDKGQSSSIVVGDIVVYQNNLVGTVGQTTSNFSQVNVVSSKASSFPAEDLSTQAKGVIRGQGNGEIILDNVLLSDTLHTGDIVATAGNQDVSGKGYPPGLVVGKVTGVNKNPSNLFQTAEIQPIIQLDKLGMVFVKVK